MAGCCLYELPQPQSLHRHRRQAAILPAMDTPTTSRATSGHFHAVRFYENKTSLSRTVSDFLAEGLAVAHPALLIATPEHREAALQELPPRPVAVAEGEAARAPPLLDARGGIGRGSGRGGRGFLGRAAPIRSTKKALPVPLERAPFRRADGPSTAQDTADLVSGHCSAELRAKSFARRAFARAIHGMML